MNTPTSHPNLFILLQKLWSHLSVRRKKQFGLLSILMLLSAFAEIISLGALMPFIGVITSPDLVFKYPLVRKVALYFDISSAGQLLLPMTIFFIFTAITTGGIRILLLWVSSRLAFLAGADISLSVYRRTLYQPYSVHISRNSSVVISGITVKVSLAIAILYQLLAALSSVVLLISIMTTLLIINTKVAIISVIIFGSCYLIISRLSRKHLQNNSRILAIQQTQSIKALQEGLGGIRDVLLDSTQEVFCDIYQRADRPLRIAKGDNIYLAGYPRFILETFGMSLIALLAYFLCKQPGGMGSALPTLAVLALGAQRLLPVLQQGYNAWAGIVGDNGSLADTIELLEQPMPENVTKSILAMPFHNEISLNSVSFYYNQEGPIILDKLSFKIPKGSRLGIIGSTGSGKSTLLDLLMGLITPIQGEMVIDGERICNQNIKSWQRTIAHVPQNIYLADSTLVENIAFGVLPNDIDHKRIRQAAEQAQISYFINSQAEGYNVMVGERGVRLSGGQRQRIGIARALYKQASVLIFDEATSALDNETERVLMEGIENLSRDLTIILVAHRLTTLKHCDFIIELKNGKIVAQGNYDQLILKHQ